MMHEKSLSRFWRQLMFVPVLYNRWLTADVKSSFGQKIAKAEQGHRGEICLLIENHLPLVKAYRQGSRGRALDLFAMHRVWDTAENTGVLIYLNLCERSLEIVADRGIDAAVGRDGWQALCQATIDQMKSQSMPVAIENLIGQVGELLCKHYPQSDQSGNELPNEVIYLS